MRPEADPRDAPSLVGRCLGPLVSRGEVPSLAYAMVRDGAVSLGGFAGVGPRAIYEIGSVTKVFTAHLVAERICGPLGLADTTFKAPVTAADRIAQGYAPTPEAPRRPRWTAPSSRS